MSGPFASRTIAQPSGLSVALGVLIALAACGGGGDDATPPPPPVAVAISPGTAAVNAGETQPFTATVSNATNTGVTWTASGGTIAGSGTTATWTAPLGGGPYTVTATSAADPSKAASATVTVNPVGIAVTPATVTVGAAGTLQLTAAVSNSSNPGVTWTASGGTLAGSGATVTWTAPVASGTYTITATSAADPSKTATATAAVTPVQVAVAPATQVLWRGEPIQLTATVTGTAQTGVTWTSSCGTVAGTGLTVTYTAPNAPGACTVTARSALDDTKAASATVTVRQAWRVAALDDVGDGACTWSHCSLREAITAANAQPDVDTIRIVNSAAGTITLSSSLPTVETPMHIIGPGVALLTLDANGSDANRRRGIEILGAFSSSLSGLTIRGGVAAGGGGISVGAGANVAITDVRLVDNEARNGDGGGIRFVGGARGQLRNVVIDSNRTVGDNQPGGGLSVFEGSVVTMIGGAIRHNRVGHGWGGGIRMVQAALTLDTVEVSGNVVQAGGGTGGGLRAEGANGTLTLRHVTVRANRTLNNAGGMSLSGDLGSATIANSTIIENQSVTGAGMVAFNVGALSITNTVIRGNRASQRGGGIHFTGSTSATIAGSVISHNIADSTGGGGVSINNTSVVRLTATAIDSNQANGPASATQGGGGAYITDGTSFEMNGGSVSGNSTQTGWGGGIWSRNASVTLAAVDVVGNRAGGSGGAFAFNARTTAAFTGGVVRDNQAVAGSGGGVLLVDGTLTANGTDVAGNIAAVRGGGFQLNTSATPLVPTNVNLTNVTVRNNRAETEGGGIAVISNANLTMTRGLVSGNRSATLFGGGLARNGAGTLTIIGTEFTANHAKAQGGGLWVIGGGATTLRLLSVSGNSADVAGGGMTLGGTGKLLEQSTVAGNTTTGGTGGGVFLTTTTSSTVRNVTLSGNSAAVGGGLTTGGAALLQNVTVVGNSASDAGAGIAVNASGAILTAANVLLAGNTRSGVAQNCGNSGGGVITSGGGNLSDDATCTAFSLGTDRSNTPAGVSPTLADNGGPTFTHALQAGSAAINAAVAASCPATDQRGFGRQGACDIGAFEFGGTPPAAGRRAAGAAPTRRPGR